MNDDNTQKGRELRLKKLLKSLLVIFAVGAAYALLCTTTNFYIPCVFRLITGYLCPGCGITHCFLSLLRGDFRGAFEANQFVFCLLPAGAVYAFYRARRYVLYNRRDYAAWENNAAIVLLIAAILFGIIRNIV